MHTQYEEPTCAVALDGGADDAVVVVRGEFDLGAVPQVQSCIDGARRPGAPLTIDLSGVTFMDSSGVNLLLRARQAGGGEPEAVVLRSPGAAVVATLTMAGLLGLFTTVGAPA